MKKNSVFSLALIAAIAMSATPVYGADNSGSRVQQAKQFLKNYGRQLQVCARNPRECNKLQLAKDTGKVTAALAVITGLSLAALWAGGKGAKYTGRKVTRGSAALGKYENVPEVVERVGARLGGGLETMGKAALYAPNKAIRGFNYGKGMLSTGGGKLKEGYSEFKGYFSKKASQEEKVE